ncbi:retropepsin-like aspartic protease family protein [Jannaschia pohangensis]|uniref:Aspartyl protease family protein n=1 Tax=Jannaschia pohangensis TaxID=390807 RepID=A0A1I3S8D0_9RHOB|nr:TIGR02281 family clan AA aspartic protease [Jannaschia pohangensis]SFJ54660.1 aspartyl protease family protein [Jannaschia pohangensis]
MVWQICLGPAGSSAYLGIMTADDTASLIYLSLFGVVVGGSYLIANRHRMTQTVQQAAIWFFIFVGAVVVFGYWEDIKRAALPQQTVTALEQGVVVEVPRGRGGHYFMTLEVNGTPIEFVVDTGASEIVLSQQAATQAGLDVSEMRFLGQAATANGIVRTATVWLDEVSLGELTDTGVRAIVNEGELDQSLLGMSYLETFGRIEIEGSRLRLIR